MLVRCCFLFVQNLFKFIYSCRLLFKLLRLFSSNVPFISVNDCLHKSQISMAVSMCIKSLNFAVEPKKGKIILFIWFFVSSFRILQRKCSQSEIRKWGWKCSKYKKVQSSSLSSSCMTSTATMMTKAVAVVLKGYSEW